MSDETTVLLLEASALPSSLEEQLVRRKTFIEHAKAREVAQVAPVLFPDLIVQSAASDLPFVLEELRKMVPRPAFVVLGDRIAIRKLRNDAHPEIGALIPQDLPVAAIAHRIASMARRSSEGKPIDPLQRRSKPPAARVRAHRSSRPPARTNEEPTTSSLDAIKSPSNEAEVEAHRKARNAQIEREKRQAEEARKARAAEAKRKADDARARAETRRREADALRRQKQEEAKQRSARRYSATPRREPSLIPTISPHSISKEQERAAALKASLDTGTNKAPPFEKKQSQPWEDDATDPEMEQVTTAYRIPVSIPENAETIKEPNEELLQVQPVQAAEANKSYDDELSIVAPLPVEMRLPLVARKERSVEVRLAFLDTDLTRADSLANAMREKGLEVFPVTPDVLQTRWPMLRRFAPQGLLVDEKAMARSAAEWVETFRGDAFLRHVPLILLRYSRLFRDQGQIELEPLLRLAEPLGKQESELLQKLAPARQVDLKLSQVPPYRLIQLLTGQDKNTRLDCRAHGERIVWPLGPGYAGQAKLLRGDSEKVLAKLSAEDSLRWLLSHEDCEVTVHEHDEPLAHASESANAEKLLMGLTEALERPTRHQSILPGTHEPTASAPAQDPSQGPIGLEAADEPIELPLSGSVFPSPGTSKFAIWTTKARRSASLAWKKYQTLLAPLGKHLDSRVLLALSIAVPLVFLVLLLTLLSGSNQDPEPPASVDAPSTPDSSTSPDTASDSQQQAPTRKRSEKENAATATDSDLAEGENADEPELGLWLVAPDSRRPSCEELLGAATPKGESKERSLSYWKRARSLLMQGKSGEALEMMCLAGLYDKTGPATEGLSQQYLAERSLEQAERWVKLSLATDPERRRSKELLGDVQSQQGKVEQARKTWLSSMSLSGEETRTLRAISRKLEKDATLALRGGDLPRAERELRRAATLDPDNASAATALAEVLAQRGVAKAAILWAQRARMIDPNDFAAVLVLGELFEDQGSKEEAAQLYRSVPPGDRHYKAAQSRLNRLL